MNSDYIYLGPAPANENCAQVGEPDYRIKAKKEMNTFIDQIYRQFPEIEETSIVIRAKFFPHDYGSYGDVVVIYDADDQESTILALKIESDVDTYWDDESLIKLNSEE